jgi:ABC-2 type transport system permease protein
MTGATTTAGIYRHLVASRVRAQLEYRLSFVLNTVGTMLLTAVDVLEIAVIFHQITQLRSWSLAEVAFLYGIAGTAFALTDLAVGHLDHLPDHIRMGTFDQFLIRPLGTLFQVISSDFDLRMVGRVTQAATVLAIAAHANHIAWTAGRVVLLAAALAAGVVIYAAVWIIGAATTFWTVNTMEFTNAFTYGGSFVGSYPVDILSQWFRRLVIFVIPVAFVSYFPALAILGRPDTLGLPHWFRYSSPAVAVAIAVAAGAVWQRAIRHYRSTGS